MQKLQVQGREFEIKKGKLQSLDYMTNKIIDKHVQEQINRDKEHWKNILFKIIVAVKTLEKNNLVFSRVSGKINEENKVIR